MKREMQLQITVEVYETFENLSSDDQVLLRRAKAGLPTAYAPYSGFQVSAAVRLANQQILVGTNHENAAYPMCLCAERVVLAAAHAQFPGVPVLAMAVTARNERNPVRTPVSSCGACRQVICETEERYHNSISIILQGETGVIYKLQSGKDLLPLAFGGVFL
jgi:cytidine deaminase